SDNRLKADLCALDFISPYRKIGHQIAALSVRFEAACQSSGSVPHRDGGASYGCPRRIQHSSRDRSGPLCAENLRGCTQNYTCKNFKHDSPFSLPQVLRRTVGTSTT